MIISTTRHLICFQVSQSNSNNERQWPLAVECKKRRQLEIKLHFHVWCTKKTQTPQSWCKNCSEITLQPWHDPETGGLDRSLQIFISQHTCKTFIQREQENWNVTQAGLSELMWSDTLVEAHLFQETDDWRTSKTLQKHFKSSVSICCPLVCSLHRVPVAGS